MASAVDAWISHRVAVILGVAFIGVGADIVTPFGGIVVSVGWFEGPEGSGFYFRHGSNQGLDIGVQAEVGWSQLNRFGGWSTEYQVGAGPGSLTWLRGGGAVPNEPADQPVAVRLNQVDSIGDKTVRDKVREALKADSAAPPVVDTVEVTPVQVSVRAGERVELARSIVIVTRDAVGNAIPGVRLKLAIEVGGEFAKVDAGWLQGLKPGTAVMLIAPPLPPDATGEPKGASRILVRVLP